MKFARLFTVLPLLIALAGCSPREEKIDGSVFIVTQGGENFKLGLVTVSIFDQQQIEPYLIKTTADLEKSLNQLKGQPESLNKKQNEAATTRDASEQQYETAKDLADDTLQKIGGDLVGISSAKINQSTAYRNEEWIRKYKNKFGINR